MIGILQGDKQRGNDLHKPWNIVACAEGCVPVQTGRGLVGRVLHVTDIDYQIILAAELLHRLEIDRLGEVKDLLLIRDHLEAFLFHIGDKPGRHPLLRWALAQNLEQNPVMLLRVDGQQSLSILYEGHGSVGAFLRPGLMLRAADNAQACLCGRQRAVLLLLVQLQGCLGSENPGHGLLQALFRQDTGLVSLPHVFQVFRVILVEQEHVTACLNAVRYGLRAIHGAQEADHGAGVRNDHAVEAQLFTQQVFQQFRRKRGRHQFVRMVRIEPLLVGWHRDMAHHHRQRTVIDQRLVNITVGFVPLLAGQGVDAGQDVLVALVHAVAREMLD